MASPAQTMLDNTAAHAQETEPLVGRSFLTDAAKKNYLEQVHEGRRALKL